MEQNRQPVPESAAQTTETAEPAGLAAAAEATAEAAAGSAVTDAAAAEASGATDTAGTTVKTGNKTRVTDSASTRPAKQPSEEQKKHKAGRAALKGLSKPVAGLTLVAQVVAFFSCCLVWVPYMALLKIGQQIILEGASPTSPAVQMWLKILMGAFALRALLYVIALTITHAADLKLRNHLRTTILNHVGKLPLAWIAHHGSGTVRKLVQDDATTIHQLVAHGPVDMLIGVLNPLALFIFALVLDWRLALVAVATIPLYFFFYLLTTRGMSEKTVVMDSKLKDVSAKMVEFVAGIAVVRAFGQSGKALKQYQDSASSFTRFYRDWCDPMVRAAAFSYIWISIPVLLLVNFGLGYLVVGGDPSFFLTIAVTSIIALVLPESLEHIFMLIWMYQLAGAASLRLEEHLKQPGLPFVAPGTGGVPADARVEFSHVSFGYGDTRVLHDINLTLEPATVTALIGPSGSGKSTLASLLARFQDPQEGSISIGGVPLTRLDQETLYKQVAFVLQDAQLLQISIRGNIALGKPDASQADIEKAARAAHIHDEIMALPRGYDTIFGGETKLSGGQEQRIAIARALLQDAPILILDEATAMADPESEAEIQRALNVLVKGRTVLVVAHRVASIKGASQIVVLRHGRIEAAGTHEELLDNAHYKELTAQVGSSNEQN